MIYSSVFFRILVSGIICFAIALPVTTKPANAQDARRLIEGIIGGGIQLNSDRKRRKKLKKRLRKQQRRARQAEIMYGAGNYSRSQIATIQRSLNAIGYNAGNPDGLSGSRTRGAIMAYQRSLGLAATGFLTAEQYNMLLGQSAAAGQGVADRELTAQETFALQAGLNKLGYDAGTPDGKSGRKTGQAVSDFLRDQGRDPYQTAPTEALGLVMQATGGQPGGPAAPGSGERSLFSEANRGVLTPGPGIDGSLPSSGPSGDPALYEAAEDINLERELAIRIISNQPELLDDDEVVARWLREDYPSHKAKKPEAPEYARMFHQGTPFERKDAIALFRDDLKNEARTDELRFIHSFRARLELDEYDAERGFPLFMLHDQIHREQKKKLETDVIYMSHLGTRVRMVFGNAPDVSYAPITDEAEARRIAEFLQDDRYAALQVRTYITVTKAGAGNFTGKYGTTDILADATLDRVTLALMPTRLSKIKEPVVLYTWPLATDGQPAQAAGTPPLELAARFGIQTLSGHLLVRRNEGSYGYSEDGWRPFLDYTHLAGAPSLIEDDLAMIHLGKYALNEREKAIVSRGKSVFNDSLDRQYQVTGADGLNEFEFPEAMAEMRRDYSAKILAGRPIFPVPIVHVVKAKLKDYDADAGYFPLEYIYSNFPNGQSYLSSLLLSRQTGAWSRENIELNLRQAPDKLTLPIENARLLVEYLSANRPEHLQRTVFVALFSKMDVPQTGPIRTGRDKGESALNFDLKPTRLAIFADHQLRELILELPLTDGWSTKNGLARKEEPLSVDAEMVALWFAKNNSNWLADDKVAASLVEMRRKIEKHGEGYLSNLPAMLPEVIVQNREKPTPDDIEKYRQTFAGFAQKADFSRLRWPYGLMGSRDDNGLLTINLLKTITQSWNGNRVFETAEADPAAEAAIKQRYPRAVDMHRIPSPATAASYVVLAPHPSWYEVKLPTEVRRQAGGSFYGYVDLMVRSVAEIDVGNGETALVFEVEPARVVHTPEGAPEASIDLESSAETSTATLAATKSGMDILGAKTGMSVDEASAALSAAGYDISNKTRLSSPDNPLGNGWVYYNKTGRKPHQIMLLTASTGDEERIIGIFRYLPEHGAETQQVYNSLKEKYGDADAAYSYNSGSLYNAWGDTETTSKKLQSEGLSNDCVIYPLRNVNLFTPSSGGGGVKSHELTETCGIVLSTFIDESLYLLLLDTDAVALQKNRMAEEKRIREAEAEARKQKKADIKL